MRKSEIFSSFWYANFSFILSKEEDLKWSLIIAEKNFFPKI